MILLKHENPEIIYGMKKNAIFVHPNYVKNQFCNGLLINGIKFSIEEVTRHIYDEFREKLSNITDANEFKDMLSKTYKNIHKSEINSRFLSELYYFYDRYIIDGKDLPLLFHYVPEGIIVNTDIPIITLENIDYRCAWLVDFISIKINEILEEVIFQSSVSFHNNTSVPKFSDEYKLEYIQRVNKTFVSYCLLIYREQIEREDSIEIKDKNELGNIYVYYDRINNKLVWHCDSNYHEHLNFLSTIKENNILDINSLLIHNDRHPVYLDVIDSRLEKLKHGVINESFYY